MNDVKVTITLSKVPGRLGFGIPLIFQGVADKAVEYTECADVEAVKTAGFDTESNVYAAASLMFKQENAPAKIAVMAATENAVTALAKVFDKGWRQLVVVSLGEDGESTVKDIASYIEEKNEKMFFPTVATAGEATDITEMDRTFIVVHTNPLASAAIVGATAGLDAGSFTYKNMIIKGVEPMDMTATEVEALGNKVTIVTKAGDVVTTDGVVSSGEFADIVDSKDYVIQQIEYQTQKALNAQPKIPYDNTGISALENITVNVLKEAHGMGIIATKDDGTAAYSTNFAPRAETDALDREKRAYRMGQFAFELAGAVHEVEIKGEIVV